MEISCDNCACSKCDHWDSCNDSIYNTHKWCYVCNDLDIDRCFTYECDYCCSNNNYLNHPLQNAIRGEY